MADSTKSIASVSTGLASGADNLNPSGISFWTLMREDLALHRGDLLSQELWRQFGNLRLSLKSRVLRVPLSLMYQCMFKACEWLCEISLPYTTTVSRRVCLEHFGGMIQTPVSVGSNVTVQQNTTIGIPSSRALAARPVIGDQADIGAGAVIVGDIIIGRGAIIGTNAVVTKSVPPYAVVVGVPGRVIRYRDPAEIGDPPDDRLDRPAPMS